MSIKGLSDVFIVNLEYVLHNIRYIGNNWVNKVNDKTLNKNQIFSRFYDAKFVSNVSNEDIKPTSLRLF